MTTPHDKEDRVQEALSRFPRPAAKPGRCHYCGGLVRAQGRRRKRFCRDLCRTRFHYARRLAKTEKLKQRLTEAGVSIDAAKSAAGIPEGPTAEEHRGLDEVDSDGE